MGSCGGKSNTIENHKHKTEIIKTLSDTSRQTLPMKFHDMPEVEGSILSNFRR